MSFYDESWYPFVLVGRTGSEVTKEQVVAQSKITKEVKGKSPIARESKQPSKVIP